MMLGDYLIARANQNEQIEERVTALETAVIQNTQDISDNTDAIVELGEIIGGGLDG